MKNLISKYQKLLNSIEEYNLEESKELEDYKDILDKKLDFLENDLTDYLYSIFNTKKYGCQLGPYSTETLLYHFDEYYKRHQLEKSTKKLKPEDIKLVPVGNENGENEKNPKFNPKMVDNIDLLKENYPELFYTLCYIRSEILDEMLDYKGLSLSSIYM